ncbi:hypothetical protein ONS96_008082 [Cadophora gregata f. sp. sojae]|nr:hypothetical protein ONS96_008082 [Cadophora gregata f. sp. sojae]
MNHNVHQLGGSPHYRQPTFEEVQQRMERAQKLMQEQQEAQEKAWFQENKAELKEAAIKQVEEMQKTLPLVDPNRAIINHLAIFYQLLLTEYTPDLNEEIGRLPPEISFEAMAHDIGVLSFAATLPKGSGDKELKKWAQISFTLLGDVKKPVNERLCNLIWLVAKKIDLAITTMQKHVKAVQKEILKGYEERFNDPAAADIMKLRHEDHRKRGDILAEKYSDLRKLLRVRFGDAEDKFKDKHKDDLKLKGEIPKEEIEQMKVATQAAEVEEFRLASEFIRDSSA